MTDEQKVKYLILLLETGLEATAARGVGCTLRAVEKERERDPGFDEQVADRVEAFNDSLEKEAIRRARDGIEEPVFFKGEEVGTVTRYSDQLLSKLLTGRRPSTYGNKQQIDAGEAGIVVVVKDFTQHEDIL